MDMSPTLHCSKSSETGTTLMRFSAKTCLLQQHITETVAFVTHVLRTDTFDEYGGRGLHSLVPEVVQFAALSDHLLFQLLLIADKDSNDSTYVGVERYSS